jgi:DNA-binding HxlR family transcriptional regulator
MEFDGATTYREFLEAGEAIPTNMLADRLERIEQQNVAEKSYDRVDPSAHSSLTQMAPAQH